MPMVETNYHHTLLSQQVALCRFVRESEILGCILFPIYLNNRRTCTPEGGEEKINK